MVRVFTHQLLYSKRVFHCNLHFKITYVVFSKFCAGGSYLRLYLEVVKMDLWLYDE